MHAHAALHKINCEVRPHVHHAMWFFGHIKLAATCARASAAASCALCGAARAARYYASVLRQIFARPRERRRRRPFPPGSASMRWATSTAGSICSKRWSPRSTPTMRPRSGQTTVILLGDLVDRGPDSAGVIALARDWQRAAHRAHPRRQSRGNVPAQLRRPDMLRHFLRYRRPGDDAELRRRSRGLPLGRRRRSAGDDARRGADGGSRLPGGLRGPDRDRRLPVRPCRASGPACRSRSSASRTCAGSASRSCRTRGRTGRIVVHGHTITDAPVSRQPHRHRYRRLHQRAADRAGARRDDAPLPRSATTMRERDRAPMPPL